ncbi:hypothetical protein KSS87_016751, partial [Heliosperma pusillum]
MFATISQSKNVCVIGAGPSGLVAARELRKEGHKVVVIEQNHDIGGQWLYDPKIEGEDPLGRTTKFLKVHSSMYESLRLQSPREIMGYSDFPFVEKKGRDMRRFPSHKEVFLYLKDFCEFFGLRDMIRFNTRVEYVGIKEFCEVGNDMKWVVKSKETIKGGCHNKVVVVEEEWMNGRGDKYIVMYTGSLSPFEMRYSYTFPFLDTKGMVTVDDDRVGPLYEHTFPPSLAPSLSFVGIPRKLIGFPFFEAQGKWVAQLLSGKRRLPSWEEMMQSIKEFYQSRDASGVPKHNTHDLANFEYCDRYGDNVGFPHLEKWKKKLCLSALQNAEVNLETFRDVYDDFELLQICFTLTTVLNKNLHQLKPCRAIFINFPEKSFHLMND